MSENLQGEDYEIIIRTKTSDGTEVVTSTDAITDKWLANAVAGYDATNQKYSAYLKDGTSSSDKLTPEYIDELAENTQSDLKRYKSLTVLFVRKSIKMVLSVRRLNVLLLISILKQRYLMIMRLLEETNQNSYNK